MFEKYILLSKKRDKTMKMLSTNKTCL